MKYTMLRLAIFIAAISLCAFLCAAFNFGFSWILIALSCVVCAAYLIVRTTAAPQDVVGHEDSLTSACLSPHVVHFDEAGIVVTVDGHRRDAMTWLDIMTIQIEIRSDKFLNFSYWVFQGPAGKCEYPDDAVGQEVIVEELKNRLPGFWGHDTEAVISRAVAAEHGEFVIWRRSTLARRDQLSFSGLA